MKLNRETLLQKLEIAYSAIALNPIIPHYSYFKIANKGDDLGDCLQAFDGLVMINTWLAEDIGVGCAIPAEPFLKLLRSLEDEEVELDFEKDKVKVKTDEVKGTFTVLDEVPVKEVTLSNNFIEDRDIIRDLIKGLSICRLYVSKDQTSGPIRGVMIDEDKLIATDRYRVIVWKLDKSVPANCSIPPKFIDIMSKNAGEVKRIVFNTNDGLTAILNDGTQISTSILSGEYPNVLQYFPTSDSFIKIKFPDTMDSVIERQITFLSRVDLIDKEISVRILNDRCITESKAKDLGSLIDEVNVEGDFDNIDIEFFVNPVFLKDIVNTCSYFKYYDENGLIILEADKLSNPDKLRYLTQARENE